MDKRKMAEEIFEAIILSERKPIIRHVEEITQGEMATLGFLRFKRNEISSGELAEAIEVSTARIATILKNLEKKTFIKRTIAKNDKRVTIVEITENGSIYIEEKREKAIANLISVIEELGEKDALEYYRIQKKISQIVLSRGDEWRKRC